MVMIISLVGFIFGLVTALILPQVYERIQEEREAEDRERYEERMRSKILQRELNEPRDRLEQNIYEQTRKEIQEREENGTR